MLKKLTLTIGLLGLSSLVMAQTEVATTQPALHVCAIKGTPDSTQFEIKKRIKVAKGTYGSVVELYPRLAERAQSSRCYVVIDYNASQRFGILSVQSFGERL